MLIEERKVVVLLHPQGSFDNTSPPVNELDTLGWDELAIDVHVGATDIGFTALKLTESDTSGSGHVDIVGSRFGTDPNTSGSTSALPSATDDNKSFGFLVDLRKRKRFVDVVLTIGDGTTGAFVIVVATLMKGKAVPNSAAERGYAQVLRIA